jgi:hypothetical protein
VLRIQCATCSQFTPVQGDVKDIDTLKCEHCEATLAIYVLNSAERDEAQKVALRYATRERKEGTASYRAGFMFGGLLMLTGFLTLAWLAVKAAFLLGLGG